jgi:hypothetical protein
MSGVFGFESDLDHGGLPCVPMAVRLKLDRTGVKLDLRAWVKFTEEERRELLALPEGPAFREKARSLALARTGETPKDLPVPAAFPWEEGTPPADLAAKAAAENVSLARWTALPALQRFALVKLSRPGHENRNFLPACREFGLLP